MKIGKYELAKLSKGDVFAGSFGALAVLGLAVWGNIHPAPQEANKVPNVTAPRPKACTGSLGALVVASEEKGGTTWRVTSIATGGRGDQSCAPVFSENGQPSALTVTVGDELNMACKYSDTAKDIRVEIGMGNGTFHGVAPVSSDFLRNQVVGRCSTPISPLESR